MVEERNETEVFTVIPKIEKKTIIWKSEKFDKGVGSSKQHLPARIVDRHFEANYNCIRTLLFSQVPCLADIAQPFNHGEFPNEV